MTELSKSQVLAKADAKAYSTLRKNHLNEFNNIKVQAAKELGVDWRPRPTAVDAAREKINSLLETHPELKEQLLAAARQQVESPEGSAPAE